MMHDHEKLSQARNNLADALKALLRAEVMGDRDFLASLRYATAAVKDLNDLLRITHWDAP